MSYTILVKVVNPSCFGSKRQEHLLGAMHEPPFLHDGLQIGIMPLLLCNV